jgi:hypothetical protein
MEEYFWWKLPVKATSVTNDKNEGPEGITTAPPGNGWVNHMPHLGMTKCDPHRESRLGNQNSDQVISLVLESKHPTLFLQ